MVSSVGMGTYLGNPTPADDTLYEHAIATSLASGVNVIDTAINYRYQRSERNIGNVLAHAVRTEAQSRDEVVVASKAGFLPFDGIRPTDARAYIHDTYIETGIIDANEIAAGCHCLAPTYLADQLERSRKNLGIQTIDIYYLHNPETQLGVIDRRTFHDRLRRAFEFLEKTVADGAIGIYGTATWSGYRVGPGDPEHLSLVELASLAHEVGGADHHFRVIQLPYNLAMPEAATQQTQAGDTPESPRRTILATAADLGIHVMASASISQGKLARMIPDSIAQGFPELDTHAQRALQFARSTPGLSTALVGMKQPAHISENLYLATVPPASPAAVQAIFSHLT